MDVTSVIARVWDGFADEKRRRVRSHYRGVGRWKDDELWQSIGKSSVAHAKNIQRILGRSLPENFRALEWGPGGGANLFGFREIVSQYCGVDISQKNLNEAMRMIKAEGYGHIFKPILLTGEPESIVSAITPVDFFLSTACFQHFPSKEYGFEVLRVIRTLCRDGAFGFIQIRYDNGKAKYKPISSLDEYEEKHITATSYEIGEFWALCHKAGFTPISVCDIRPSINYATFYLTAA